MSPLRMPLSLLLLFLLVEKERVALSLYSLSLSLSLSLIFLETTSHLSINREATQRVPSPSLSFPHLSQELSSSLDQRVEVSWEPRPVSMNGEVEMNIVMEEEEEENEPFYGHGSKDYHEIGVVHIGDRIVETTIIEYDFVVKHWLRYIDRYYRKRRGPHVAGLAVFRGLPRPPIWTHWRRPTGRPSNPDNPIRAISLCLGGSHCLLYRNDGYEDFRTPKGLNDFFGRRDLAVVGIGVKRDAEWLAAEWGIHIAHPVELRTLAARAFGNDQVWVPRYVQRRIVIESPGLEELTELVLDGARVGKKPEIVEDNDWGDEAEEEHIMYATRDAFLCFEIGLKCLKMIGHRT